eukprot:14778201-Alexandrium_andersonii.AAC.1
MARQSSLFHRRCQLKLRCAFAPQRLRTTAPARKRARGRGRRWSRPLRSPGRARAAWPPVR